MSVVLFLVAGNFKALYDIGFAFPGISHTPNFTDLLLGRPMTVFLYVRYVQRSWLCIVDHCVQNSFACVLILLVDGHHCDVCPILSVSMVSPYSEVQWYLR